MIVVDASAMTELLLQTRVGSYDAMYVALAEALDAPVVTCDRPLRAAPGVTARIEVIR